MRLIRVPLPRQDKAPCGALQPSTGGTASSGKRRGSNTAVLGLTTAQQRSHVDDGVLLGPLSRLLQLPGGASTDAESRKSGKPDPRGDVAVPLSCSPFCRGALHCLRLLPASRRASTPSEAPTTTRASCRFATVSRDALVKPANDSAAVASGQATAGDRALQSLRHCLLE